MRFEPRRFRWALYKPRRFEFSQPSTLGDNTKSSPLPNNVGVRAMQAEGVRPLTIGVFVS